jgi:RNA polymerase sigma factor (sigma-70 family)
VVTVFAREPADVTRGADIELAVARFGSEMYGLALAIAANRADADDAYQSAWMDAMRHWDQVRTESKRRAWLAAIVARSARRTRRQRGLWMHRNAYLSDDLGLAAVMEWDPTLATAVSELSRRQRAVVALHYGQGYALDEVAEILRCGRGTVRTHLSRALGSLRRSLRDDDA